MMPRMYILPFRSERPAEVGDTVEVSARPQRACVARRFIVAGLCVPYFELSSFRIGSLELLTEGATVPAELFSYASMAGIAPTSIGADTDVRIAARATDRPFNVLRDGGPIPLHWLTRRRLPGLRRHLRTLVKPRAIPKFQAMLHCETE